MQTNQLHRAIWLWRQRRERGHHVIPHSLTLSRFFSFFFLFFVFLLLLLQSLTICLAGELHGHRRDLYMIISFFSWSFCILSSFSSFFFFFLLSFSDEASTPPLWATFTPPPSPWRPHVTTPCTSGVGEAHHPSWWLLLLQRHFGS